MPSCTTAWARQRRVRRGQHHARAGRQRVHARVLSCVTGQPALATAEQGGRCLAACMLERPPAAPPGWRRAPSVPAGTAARRSPPWAPRCPHPAGRRRALQRAKRGIGRLSGSHSFAWKVAPRGSAARPADGRAPLVRTAMLRAGATRAGRLRGLLLLCPRKANEHCPCTIGAPPLPCPALALYRPYGTTAQLSPDTSLDCPPSSLHSALPLREKASCCSIFQDFRLMTSRSLHRPEANRRQRSGEATSVGRDASGCSACPWHGNCRQWYRAAHTGASARLPLAVADVQIAALPACQLPRTRRQLSPDELPPERLLGQLPPRGPEGQGEEAEEQAASGHGGDGPEGDKRVPSNGKGTRGHAVGAARRSVAGRGAGISAAMCGAGGRLPPKDGSGRRARRH